MKQSFSAAIHGILTIARNERNFRMQSMITLCVLGAGFFFHISRIEWMFVIGVASLVLILESVNATVEALIDILYPRFDAHAGRVKDMMAGSVLLGAVTAGIIGVLIFIPYIIVRLGSL